MEHLKITHWMPKNLNRYVSLSWTEAGRTVFPKPQGPRVREEEDVGTRGGDNFWYSRGSTGVKYIFTLNMAFLGPKILQGVIGLTDIIYINIYRCIFAGYSIRNFALLWSHGLGWRWPKDKQLASIEQHFLVSFKIGSFKRRANWGSFLWTWCRTSIRYIFWGKSICLGKRRKWATWTWRLERS